MGPTAQLGPRACGRQAGVCQATTPLCSPLELPGMLLLTPTGQRDAWALSTTGT